MIAAVEQKTTAEETPDVAGNVPSIEGDWPALDKLFPDIDWFDCEAWVGIEVPDAKVVVATLLQAVRQIEGRHGVAEGLLEELTVCFEGHPDDLEVDRRAAIAELEQADKLLEQLRHAIAAWYQCIGLSRLVELDADTWGMIVCIGQKTLPTYLRNRSADTIMRAALCRLNDDPDAGEAVAEAERRRLGSVGRQDRDGWPWDGAWKSDEATAPACGKFTAAIELDPGPEQVDRLVVEIVAALRQCDAEFLLGIRDELSAYARRPVAGAAKARGAGAPDQGE